MTRRIYQGLLALAGFLLAIIAVESFLPRAIDLEAAHDASSATGPVSTGMATTRQSETWSMATLLGRPLFRPSRAPEVSATIEALGTAGLAELRLAGIIAAPNLKRAVFQAAGNGKAVAVGEGERLGDWTVTAIDATTVTVAKAGEIRRLHPRFALSPAAAPPYQAATPSAPTRPPPGEELGSTATLQMPPRPLISDRP